MPGETETSVSPLLRWLGFEVTTELAPDWVELSATLPAFTRRRLEADVSLAFHAGHGIELNPLAGLMQRALCRPEREQGQLRRPDEDLLADDTLVAFAAPSPGSSRMAEQRDARAQTELGLPYDFGRAA